MTDSNRDDKRDDETVDTPASEAEASSGEASTSSADAPDTAAEPVKAAKTAKKENGLGTVVGILGFVAALGGGFFIGQWINDRDQPSQVELEKGPRYKVSLDGDEPQLGPDDALVTIIEFADYQCPYCVRAAGPLKEAVEDDDDVRLIYMHYPLPGHRKAGPAARAAWAAHQQGKFWEVHAWLFENKAELTGLQDEVESLDMDWAQFQKDMEAPAAAKSVDDDFLAGSKVGVTGTPSFVVNGHRYVGLKTVADWKKIIEGEKEDAQRLVESGTPRAQLYAALMEDAVEQKVPPRKKAQRPRRPGEPDPAVTYKIPTADRPGLGPEDALVTIVEFSDFECPFCQRTAPTMHQLVEANDDVRVVFRNLPLPMHPHAKEAAKAGLAAHRQGKFWEMHDKLFDNRERLGSSPYVRLAEEIGLDVGQFEADMQDPQLDAMIDEDLAVARQFGVRGAPASFVNGRFVSGAQPASAFQSLIDDERSKARALVDEGTPPAEVYAKLMESAATKVESP